MRRMIVPVVLCLTAFATGMAQTTETPVAFDSAGRIVSVNPTLAARLELRAPEWPVVSDFAEARLYKASSGGYVLVVQRPKGERERYALSDEQTAALRSMFARASARVGGVVAEDEATIVAEPARGPFVRNQMVLAAAMYGPAVAELTHDATVGTGTYLFVVGGTFFALTDFARTHPITRAQNSMATDGAFRGWAVMASTVHAAGVNLNGDANAVSILVGGVGGSIVGYQMGRRLTNSEAQAAMTGSTITAGTVLGLVGTTGALSHDSSGRGVAAAIAAGGVAGYLLGPRYPRSARYTVTAGDIQVVRLGSYLGLAAALTPIATNDHVDDRVAAALATTGWVGGALIADRIAARPFNHSESDARMVEVGAIGGALIGLAVPVMAKSDNASFVTGMAAGGGILGAIAAQGMMDPPRQGSPAGGSERRNDGSRPHLQLDPQGLAMTVVGQRGNHSLLHITF